MVDTDKGILMMVEALMGNIMFTMNSITTKATQKKPCYKLHRYLKRKGETFNSHANNVAAGKSQSNDVFVPPHVLPTNSSMMETQGVSLFTQEQYNQILQLLSRGKGVDISANVATNNATSIITAPIFDRYFC